MWEDVNVKDEPVQFMPMWCWRESLVRIFLVQLSRFWLNVIFEARSKRDVTHRLRVLARLSRWSRLHHKPKRLLNEVLLQDFLGEPIMTMSLVDIPRSLIVLFNSFWQPFTVLYQKQLCGSGSRKTIEVMRPVRFSNGGQTAAKTCSKLHDDQYARELNKDSRQ